VEYVLVVAQPVANVEIATMTAAQVLTHLMVNEIASRVP
jgi:hypothetical protein